MDTSNNIFGNAEMKYTQKGKRDKTHNNREKEREIGENKEIEE